MEPVVSEREAELSEEKTLEKRPESALHPAAPKQINEMATSCGPTADRRDAHMDHSLARNNTLPID
jgi:hypothetical protein